MTTTTTVAPFNATTGDAYRGGNVARLLAAELATAVDTVRGAFLSSPSGTTVYVMRETSRMIKGRKWRGLSVVHVIPAGDVIALRVAP